MITSHNTDYSDPNLILLGDQRGWGGPGYYNNRIVNDRIWQYHGEIAKDLNSNFLSQIVIGGNYTNHHKGLTPDEYFVDFANGSSAGNLALPSQYNLGSVDLDWLGLGHSLAYDPLQLLSAGIYTLVPNTALDVAVKAYQIQENLGTIYGLFNIKSHLGGADLTGNVGVQAVHDRTEKHGEAASFANRTGPTMCPFPDQP